MHHFDTLLSKISLQIEISYQIATKCTIQIHCFQNVIYSSKTSFQIASACNNHCPYFHISRGRLAYLTPNSIMSTIVLFFSLQCHNARISVLVFKIVSVFLNVSNTVRMQASKALFSFNYMQFQIVSNTTRVHALQTLFSFFSRQFQIVLNTVRVHASKTLFSKVSLKFQIVSNTVRIYPSIKAYML